MDSSEDISDSIGDKGPYRTAISLRIRHPSLPPDVMTKGLGFNPELCHSAGSRREAPSGKRLHGVYPETFWLYSFPFNCEMEVEECIENAITALMSKEIFLRETIASGGSAELFFGVFLRKNAGIEIDRRLLGRVADLGLNLSFDIYVPDGVD